MSDAIQFPDKGTLNTYTYLPITMKQFEELTNEILAQMNVLMVPHALEADYLAQVLMSAIHALDHKIGKVRKSDLFEACINRVSCHVTYHVVEEIQKKLKAKAGENAETMPLDPRTEAEITGENPDILPDEVHGVMPAPPDTVA